MTFDARETSEQQGAPVELYEFYVDNQVMRYTSCESDQTVSSNLYTSAPIVRGNIALSVESPRNALKLEVPRNFAVADLYRVGSPREPVGLIVKAFHRADAEVGTMWVGKVLNVNWEHTVKAIMNCEPASISAKRQGLGRYIQVPCPYALFDVETCKVDKELFRHPTFLGTISGKTVTVGSVMAGLNYLGGFIEWNDGNSPAIYERRLIVARSGLTMTLNRPFSSTIQPSDVVDIFPGCDHLLTTCDEDYDNLENNGGFSHMPEKNPFNGAPVF